MDMTLHELLEDCFTYLDELRDTGHVNMFQSPTFLATHFLLEEDDAYLVFVAWVNRHAKKRPRHG